MKQVTGNTAPNVVLAAVSEKKYPGKHTVTHDSRSFMSWPLVRRVAHPCSSTIVGALSLPEVCHHSHPFVLKTGDAFQINWNLVAQPVNFQQSVKSVSIVSEILPSGSEVSSTLTIELTMATDNDF